jgi:hypothetical protein
VDGVQLRSGDWFHWVELLEFSGSCTRPVGMETQAWAWEEFGKVRTGDLRRTKRVLLLAQRAAESPDGCLAAVCRSRREREGAYDLLQSGRVSAETLLEGICSATANRCSSVPRVHVAVDGSSIRVGGDVRGESFGAVGSHTQKGRGIKVISGLAVGPAGQALGITSQVWWTRTQRQRLSDCRKRAVADKETRFWLEAIDGSRQVLNAGAPDTKLCFVLDREADNQSVLKHLADVGSEFIIRARHNRRLDAGNRRTRPRAAGTPLLLDAVKKASVVARCRLTMPAREGRPARIAQVAVRTVQARLMRLNRRSQMLAPLEVNVVDVQETGRPRLGPPMRWTLLTNRPVNTARKALAIVEGYTCRWRIEELHRTWKSGSCNVERSQLRSVSALTAWATLLATVAARIERIKHLSRNMPNASALELYSADELIALRMMRKRYYPDATLPDTDALSVGTATAWLADMGGYVQTSARRPPGTVVLARGLERLRLCVDAMVAARTDHDRTEK